MGKKHVYKLYVERTIDLPAITDQLGMSSDLGRSEIYRRAGLTDLAQVAHADAVLNGRCQRLSDEEWHVVEARFTRTESLEHRGDAPDDVAILLASISELEVFSTIELKVARDGEIIAIGLVNASAKDASATYYAIAQWGSQVTEIADLVVRHRTLVHRLAIVRSWFIGVSFVAWPTLTICGLFLAIGFSNALLAVMIPNMFMSLLNKKNKKYFVIGWVIWSLCLVSIIGSVTFHIVVHPR